MRVEERATTEHVLRGRERFVPRGVATSDLVVSRAWGARIWDADGREYIDFAGGIACQNLGHGNATVVRAVHEQVDRYLHQCFMVGLYEPYVAVAEKLDDLWPGKAATKTLLVNSGAEAIPPYSVTGSSRIAAITSRGFEAGKNPMNDAMYFPE